MSDSCAFSLSKNLAAGEVLQLIAAQNAIVSPMHEFSYRAVLTEAHIATASASIAKHLA